MFGKNNVVYCLFNVEWSCSWPGIVVWLGGCGVLFVWCGMVGFVARYSNLVRRMWCVAFLVWNGRVRGQV